MLHRLAPQQKHLKITVSPIALAPTTCCRPSRPRRKLASRLHKAFEAAKDHPLGVERQRPGVHHIGHPLVGHHLGVDAVALRARPVSDPGEHHGLPWLELDAARERGALSTLDVVSDPFPVIQRAVPAPDLARLLRHAAVSLKILLRHSDNKSIDVRHWRSSRYSPASRAIMDYVWQQAAVPEAGSSWSRSRRDRLMRRQCDADPKQQAASHPPKHGCVPVALRRKARRPPHSTTLLPICLRTAIATQPRQRWSRRCPGVWHS